MKIDLTGKRFGRLTVVALSEERRHGKRMWICDCECGNQKLAKSTLLINGATKSCGCILFETAQRLGKINCQKPTHGGAHTKLYQRWFKIKDRCTNQKSKDWKYYGGRGIKICDRWLDFKNFRQDMGQPPPKMSIERINNDGNYEPSNCKWATQKEQMQNTRHKRNCENEKTKRPRLKSYC